MNLIGIFGLQTVAILLATYPIGINCSRNKYCDIKCGTLLHTLCQHGNPCYTTCPYLKKFKYLTDEQREAMLHKHNEYRNYMASGAEKRKGFGDLGISNMNILSWSNEAEYIASCVARRCEYELQKRCHHIIHGEFLTCGQNVWYDYDSNVEAKYNTPGAMNVSVSGWYSIIEECGCNHKSYSKERGGSQQAFTQIVWANTRFVGCAYVAYSNKHEELAENFCNYCPSGNIVGQPYFQTEGKLGPHCGKYKRYPYLCGIQRPYEEDPFIIEAKNCGSPVCHKNRRNINNFVITFVLVNLQCILYTLFFICIY